MTTLEQIKATDDFMELVASEHQQDQGYMDGMLVEVADIRNIINDINIDLAIYVGLTEYDVDGTWNETRVDQRVVDETPDELTTKEWAEYFDRIVRENRMIQKIKVEQMTSSNSFRPIANQFTISTPEGRYFQSYQSIICFVQGDKITLDENKWDYLMTTSKYRNQFLGENTTETRKKIDSGVYKLANLN